MHRTEAKEIAESKLSLINWLNSSKEMFGNGIIPADALAHGREVSGVMAQKIIGNA